MPPRWVKVLRDLWGYKTRSLLVILSIAVGVFAIGTIAGAQQTIDRQLWASYQAANPYDARIGVGGFDDALIQSIGRMPEIDAVAARFSISVRVRQQGDRWRDLTLYALSDFQDIPVNRVIPQPANATIGAQEATRWPPDRGQVVLERNSVPLVDLQPDQTMQLELPDGRLQILQVAGTAYDINLPPARFANRAFGFVGFDTLERWGYDRQFGELMFTVVEDLDTSPCAGLAAAESCRRKQIEAVVAEVRDKVEAGGYRLGGTRIPDPGSHPAEDILNPLFLILGVLGALSLGLSGFLVVNTIAAVLAQQIRQIGVMKTVGARTRQVMVLYFGKALIYGLLSLAVGIPLGTVAAYALARFAAGFLNFDVTNQGIYPQVLALQVGVAILMPLIAAAIPVTTGSRVTVQEAISAYGLGKGRFGSSKVDRLLVHTQRWLPFLSRPLLLSLRNTVRRKARLALTMATLILGGAIFIAVFSVRLSLARTLEETQQYFNYHVYIQFDRQYRIAQIRQEALKVPGIAAVEAWEYGWAVRERPDGSASDSIRVRAPMADTTMIEPNILRGRWLVAEDENALVLSSSTLDEEPDIDVGDQITLQINDRKTQWTIVGVVQSALVPPTAYANYPYFSRLMGDTGRANYAQIALAGSTGDGNDSQPPLDPDDAQTQLRLARALEQHFTTAGYQVSLAGTIAEDQESVEYQFGILITFLLVMALLMAVVGGMGLMGTMSINVLERTREIGVLRAIGASNQALMQIILVEGLLIGVISWGQGALLALPVGKLMSDQIGLAFVDSPLSYGFSWQGVGLWLAVAVVVAAIASYLPARNAARLTVREVLSYE